MPNNICTAYLLIVDVLTKTVTDAALPLTSDVGRSGLGGLKTDQISPKPDQIAYRPFLFLGSSLPSRLEQACNNIISIKEQCT